MSDRQISNEDLLEMVKARGLFQETNTESKNQSPFDIQLSNMSEEHRCQIASAKSPQFIPQGAKTALMDIAVSYLLNIEG